MKYRFPKGSEPDQYEVRHPVSGELLGTIRKRMNRRPYRSTPIVRWVATGRNKQTLKDGGGHLAAEFMIRDDAAQALARRF